MGALNSLNSLNSLKFSKLSRANAVLAPRHNLLLGYACKRELAPRHNLLLEYVRKRGLVPRPQSLIGVCMQTRISTTTLISCQSGVVVVHHKRKHQRIVQVVQPLVFDF